MLYLAYGRRCSSSKHLSSFTMNMLVIFLLTLGQQGFAETTTDATSDVVNSTTTNRTTVACYLGDGESLDDYLPFSRHYEVRYHVPSITTENCSVEEAYPECLTGMFGQIRTMHQLIHETIELKKHSFIALGTSVHLRFVELLKSFYENITTLGEPEVGEENHNNCFRFNLTNWRQNLDWHDYNYFRFHYYESFFRELYRWHYVYFPIAFPVFLIVGLTGNVIVLLILARNHLMWTTANKVVLNLAIADIFFLVINVGIFYLSFHSSTQLNTTLCYVKVYGENLATAACVYSTALLSFLRYMAIAAIAGGCPRRVMSYRRTVPFLLMFIWMLAAVAAIPNIVHMSHRVFDCDTLTHYQGGTIGINHLNHIAELESSLTPQITRLITICVLPLSVIVFFSMATTRLLRKSARDIPGEAVGLGNARHDREKGAYITLALVTIFVVTHVPIHIANLVFLYRDAFGLSYAQCLPLLYIPRILFPLNSCLNPVGLFVASKTFRKYLKNILLCGSLRKMPYNSCAVQTQISASGR